MRSLIKLVYGKTAVLTGSAIIGHYGFSEIARQLFGSFLHF